MYFCSSWEETQDTAGPVRKKNPPWKAYKSKSERQEGAEVT